MYSSNFPLNIANESSEVIIDGGQKPIYLASESHSASISTCEYAIVMSINKKYKFFILVSFNPNCY